VHRYLAVVITLVTLTSNSSLAQDGGNSEQLSKLIPNLMSYAEAPGLSIATIEVGKIAWIGSFGVKNTKTGALVDVRTVFPAASLGKVVFAYAVLKLVDKGTLDLDVPLSRYVPAYVENDDRVNLITARHVLTHRTGFPNWRPGGKPLLMHFEPGERFSYSGEGFVYLQRAIETMTGQSLDDFMQQTVFRPLGMTNSSYVWQERYEALAVSGHTEAGVPSGRGKTVEGASPINGGGGPAAASTLLTTAADYAKFMVAVMNGTGLKQETARRMLAPQSPVQAGCSNCVGKPVGKASDAISWGLGVGLATTARDRSFWQWGDNGDFKAFATGSEASGRGVVIFTNSANGMMIIPDIVREAIGEMPPAFDWLHYERYDSPRMKLYRSILNHGADKALKQYEMGPPLNEDEMNRLGLRLLRTKKFDEAIRTLELNVAAFPKSANAWDSLAEAYMIGGKELAIAYYRKSLELNPANPGAVENLKKLEAK
jgi:CubicO group peptidase (beta-lactamase class C family)